MKRQPCLAATAAAKLLQSCPTLCDPIDSSPPGSPVPGILQARALEWVAHPTLCNPIDHTVQGILQARILAWVAIFYYRGSSQPRV